MSALKIEVAPKFTSLLRPARYKGLYGGRGAGKSHQFATMAVGWSLWLHRCRIVCIREVQKALRESVKMLIEDKIAELQVEGHFRSLHDRILTPGGGMILFQGMQEHSKESIKSLEGFDVGYVEEAQVLSKGSLEMLRPTIRRDPTPERIGSELWFSWNPRSAKDPVDALLRGPHPPEDAIVLRVGYRDNPFFPSVLEEERQHDYMHARDRYAHIWEGEYEPVAIGAIWDRPMFEQHRRIEAPEMGRIVVAVDPAISAEEDSNEHGIIVAGLGVDGRAYVLEDATMKGKPSEWAARVAVAYDAFEADCVVIETNQGGDMVRHTLEANRPTLPIEEVKATRGKHVRAEPIAALYSLGRVSHVGSFLELEDQMCQMTAGGFEGKGSPDRVDALVWALTELMPSLVVKTSREPDRERVASPQGWMGA